MLPLPNCDGRRHTRRLRGTAIAARRTRPELHLVHDVPDEGGAVLAVPAVVDVVVEVVGRRGRYLKRKKYIRIVKKIVVQSIFSFLREREREFLLLLSGKKLFFVRGHFEDRLTFCRKEGKGMITDRLRRRRRRLYFLCSCQKTYD